MAQIGSTLTAETGDLSEYDSTTVETDNTLEASTDQAYAGSYSFKSSFGGTNEGCYGEKVFTEGSERWTTCRVYVPSALNFGSTFQYMNFLNIVDGTISVAEIGVYRYSESTVERWRCYDRTNTTSTVTNYSADTWHYIKIQFVQGDGTGIARIWVDGTLIHEYTDLAYPSYLCDRIRAGGTSGNAPSTGSIFIDNIKFYDSDPDAGGTIIPILTANRRRIIS